jgi:hypothetical protein
MANYRTSGRVDQLDSARYFVTAAALPAAPFTADAAIVKTGNAFSRAEAEAMLARLMGAIHEELEARGDRAVDNG